MNQTISANRAEIREFSIPDFLNIFILIAASSMSILLLKYCSESHSLVIQIICGLLFSFTANTLFSLLHEAVHGHLHSNTKMNHFMGMICAAFYPTGFSLQRAFHLSHHKNNRTDKEQFDYLHESDNKFIKYAQWYCILTGLYWVFAVIGAFLIMLVPGFLIKLIDKSKLSRQTGADSMFARLNEENYPIIRLELLFALGVQFLIHYYLQPSLLAYVICYGLFAINWSSLQYADHAFSVLDPREGAWNLRVSKFTQYLFLNYHAHKVHHLYMNVPWLHLYKLVPKDEYKPHFISIYLEMWKGPKKFPKDANEANLNHPAFTYLNGEWTALKEFYHFSKRNIRYFRIAVFLYLPAFVAFKKLRYFRFGFSLLQHIDDVMDGDRKIDGDPLELIKNIKHQLKTEQFEPNRTGILAAVLFKSIRNSSIDKEEMKHAIISLIEIMEFDYKRRRDRLILNEAELEKVLSGTFFHSINLAMILWQSELRAKDAEWLIKCFNWCTVIRDFKDDLDLGIINIPEEIMKAGNLKKDDDSISIIKEDNVQKWMYENYLLAGPIIENSTRQLNELKGIKGAFLLRIFHDSIQGYHKRFPKIFKETLYAKF